jgi:type II secretory pathway component GspD/PulD (secretin)
MSLTSRFAAVVAVCAAVFFCGAAFEPLPAQELRVITQDGAPKVAPPQAAPAAPQQPEPPKEGEKPAGAPGATPGKPEAKPGEKPAEPGRPRRKPSQPANPDELKSTIDDDGRVAFSFKGQDWEDVLEWLADISGASLQMEEVPPGFLNLTSRGRYTVKQVQDLFNAALNNKGYTLLRNGDILQVVKLEKLDKSLVPRVEPDELEQYGAYEFVKCFFDLDSLLADNTAEEIKPMLSPHGKITALKTTNRLDIVETAGNLRRIRDFFAEEQSDRGKENVLREFKLKFVRATDVYETLHTILGLKKVGPSVALTPDQIQQMQQQFMQAAQQAAQGQGKPGGQGPGKEVYLAINKSENSILANAPPDKMTIIEQAVKAMDIAKNKSESLLSNLPRLRSYKLSNVDPASLVKVLEDLGNLDPQTRLEVDNRSRSIIAFATPIDHVTIQAMVDKIDGTGRKFEVIQLYVLDAENVAGSIEFLMRGPDDKNRSRYNPFYFEFGMSSRGQDRDPADQLQVEADSERNRLLIRATDSEMKEIRQLLAKLGELPDDDRGRQTMRVVPMSPGDMQSLIERIQDTWPSVAPNPLKIAPVDTPANGTPANGTDDEKPQPPPRRRTESRTLDSSRSELIDSATESSRALSAVSRKSTIAVAQVGDPSADLEFEIDSQVPFRKNRADEADDAQPPQRAPTRSGAQPPAAPIAVSPGPHGLVISSQDTEALDQLERMITELTPTQRISSKLFYLKNSFCKDVADVLKDIFKEGDSVKPNPFSDELYYYYRYGSGGRDSAKERSRLSKRKPLKFIPEPVTNTLLVIGADSSQLADIERLIKIYDEGIRPDSNSVRITRQIGFHYTTAREVSEVIKDVFRDLLSPNDKAMAKAGQQQQAEQAKAMYSTTYIFGDDADRDNARKFKGLLSMGVDDRSNTLTVSAPKDLMTIITDIAEELDKAAGESRGVISVLKTGSTLDPAALQETLFGVGKSPTGVKPQSAPEQPRTQPQPQAQPQSIRSETIVVPN